MVPALSIDFLLGLLIGGLGGLVGIGGGVIAIPVLGLLYGMPQQMAQGTALVMVVPNVLLGFWRYRQQVGVDGRMAALVAVGAVGGTYPAARLATGFDPATLRAAFAAFLLALAAYYAWQALRGRIAVVAKRPPARGWVGVLGIAGGAVSGMFGVGGAYIAVPTLTLLFGLRQLAAQGLALALVAPGTLTALIAYAHAGAVDWPRGLALAAGGMIGIYAGVPAASRLPERGLRLLFCSVLALAGGALAMHG